MTTVLIFILLIIIAVVAVAIINQNNSELGSEPEDILVEQARVLELKAQLEKVEARERKELEALRREMRILEKENAKNVLTLEKELIASGLKGKAAEDALRKELEDTKRAEQAKVDAIQLQLTKTKTQEAAKVKSLQFELDKSQARIGIMEKNVEKLKTKPAEELAKLKSELAAAKAQSSSLKRNMEKITSGRSEAAAELKALQDELNELKKAEAIKISTLKEKLGDSTSTIEDLEDEIAYLKSGAAIDKSPDTKKINFPIESDEVRASAMDSQNIVENDVEKKMDDPRAMNKGPDSLGLSQAMREKLAAAGRKVMDKERNEKLKENLDRMRHMGPTPSPELIRLGPPSMKPAVCRDIPGSPIDSCGRPVADLTSWLANLTGDKRYQPPKKAPIKASSVARRVPTPSCKYEPFNPNKNYPGSHPDNYFKYCNDLVSGDCAEELCKNTDAKNACKGECQAVMARPPDTAPPAPKPPPPAPMTGYTDNGPGFCKSGQIYASPAWALLKPGEPRKMASSFDDPLYREYAKRGQDKCNANPFCKFVTVWRDAGYRMYNSSAGDCSSKDDTSGTNKSWKKIGFAGGKAPPPLQFVPPPLPKPPPAFKPLPMPDWRQPPVRFNPFIKPPPAPTFGGPPVPTFGRPPVPTFGGFGRTPIRPTRGAIKAGGKGPAPPPPPPPPAKKNCVYSSVNLRGPGGWFGWSSEKDGLGREMKGIVVSKHKVHESAVGGGKKCCEALGCPSDCKDPGVGQHVYKKRATIGRIGSYSSMWPSYKGKFTLERTSGQKACDNNSYV